MSPSLSSSVSLQNITKHTHRSSQLTTPTEPDSLGNLVTNLNVAKCQESQTAYINGVEYAVKTLDFPNVSSYIDAIAAIIKKYPDVPISLVIGKSGKYVNTYFTPPT